MTASTTARTTEHHLLVGGEWQRGEGREIVVLDKFSLKPRAVATGASPAQIGAILDAADAAFRAGPPVAWERGAILDRAAALLAERVDSFVACMQGEAGFTEADARGEHQRTLQTLRLSAEEARRLTGDMLPIEGAPGQAGRLGFTLRVPLGIIAAITPFNAPLNTVAHKVAPAIAAGNAVIVKPSSLTPGTACLLAQVFIDAGLPPGLLSILHAGGAETAPLLADERVRFFAFTGSTGVGRTIQAAAGLRRTQMELGSIAFTILAEDADLDRALPKVVNASFRKAGQVCTSIQLLLVHRSRHAEVAERLGKLVNALRHGDPRGEGVFVGPVISQPEAERIESWIDEAVASGARRLAGGPREGAVVPPTLLDGVDPSMRLGCAEVFGPVLAIDAYDDLDAAIDRVNATPFGLATGFFTNRLDDAFAAARRLVVGGVHINETSSARVDMMPYGGSKDSGFGREGPHYAVMEMTEERVVTIAL